MNRRGFLRAVGATGMWLLLHRPAAAKPSRHQRGLELLRAAIAGRKVIRFRYQGLEREAEPHALGVVSGGRPAFFGWQTKGRSRTDPPPGWRTFVLSEIKELRGLKKPFAPRADYRPERSGLHEIETDVHAAR
ncbi:MAG: WYL domain-containing protein [Candidatus Didemnitutus sp.]|nr:WYL domain-containing protein [Candidatus Didemnitutus sp.]